MANNFCSIVTNVSGNYITCKTRDAAENLLLDYRLDAKFTKNKDGTESLLLGKCEARFVDNNLVITCPSDAKKPVSMEQTEFVIKNNVRKLIGNSSVVETGSDGSLKITYNLGGTDGVSGLILGRTNHPELMKNIDPSKSAEKPVELPVSTPSSKATLVSNPGTRSLDSPSGNPLDRPVEDKATVKPKDVPSDSPHKSKSNDIKKDADGKPLGDDSQHKSKTDKDIKKKDIKDDINFHKEDIAAGDFIAALSLSNGTVIKLFSPKKIIESFDGRYKCDPNRLFLFLLLIVIIFCIFYVLIFVK